ncbi:MAG: alpha/beta fold hydrolase [Deltaproteobacteria bacterium]|nr:alpha/beta fold hydrolase [Deltaproteobacteria bacterium]
MCLYVIIAIVAVYLVLTLFLTYVVLQVPRQPVYDTPDWGQVLDTRIPALDGGELEVWRIEPDGPSRGVVVLAHGWSRNRDRMVPRARLFAEMGFTTVIHSARDHGRSTRHHFMNAVRFAEDIEAVLNWIDEPVLLYGHSAGAAGAIIAASRNPERIILLFLEGCYARTKEALRSLYRNYNLMFGILFGSMIVLWIDIFYRFRMDKVSPVRLASQLDIPVLIIHGEKDQNFPLHHAWRLRNSFPADKAILFVAKGADHSSCSLTPEYPTAVQAFVDRYL